MSLKLCALQTKPAKPVRFTPLLIILLSIGLHSEVAANESASFSNSYDTQPVAAVFAPVSAVRSDTEIGASVLSGPALGQSNTTAGSFDLSYLLVLGLGIGGLVWMRKQSRNLTESHR